MAVPALRVAETFNAYTLPSLIKSRKFPNKSSSSQWSCAVFFSVEVSRRLTSSSGAARGDKSMGSFCYQAKTKSKNSCCLHADEHFALNKIFLSFSFDIKDKRC